MTTQAVLSSKIAAQVDEGAGEKTPSIDNGAPGLSSAARLAIAEQEERARAYNTFCRLTPVQRYAAVIRFAQDTIYDKEMRRLATEYRSRVHKPRGAR